MLIGANDVSHQTSIDTFTEYYSQILDMLEINKFKAVYCAEIPAMHADGHAFFSSEAAARLDHYNKRIESIVSRSRVARMVRFDNLDDSCFVDPAHFSETGNERIAESFANVIREF